MGVVIMESSGNYLRVRGEYSSFLCFPRLRWELPPRARRIPTRVEHPAPWIGTTSACAENTSKALASNMISRNYLRVRGEYDKIFPGWREQMELPPRARRILFHHAPPRAAQGTTSACAENTLILLSSLLIAWNYLRVRGEYVNNA